ncbi:MAG TPA: hypothetical protein ENH82_04990 [bacterium]|nr:hypothetical protein [bacterium]
MVPHEGIEDEFHTRLNKSGQVLAVTSIPDERKGEKLVVLFTKEAGDKETLRKIMAGSSLPNLWKPNDDCYVMIDEMPVLGSGKMDIKKLRELALDRVVDSQ